MAQVDGKPIDLDAIEAKLRTPEYSQVAYSLSQIGFYSAQDLFSTFAGKGPELLPWLADAQVNRDRNLRLQYLAGLGLNKYEQGAIYANMLNYRTFPEGLFTGSPERIEALRQAITWRQ
jgi:spermidine synthase